MCFIPLSCPGKRFKGFHPSTLTSSEPQTLPDPDLSVIRQAKTNFKLYREGCSRVQVPNHDDCIVTPASKPSPRMCPPHDEHWSCVHAQRTERLRWSTIFLARFVQDGFGRPDSNLRIETSGRYPRVVRMNVYGEHR